MKLHPVIIGFCMLSVPGLALAEKCQYSLDPSTVKVGWTAFKTTEKLAVKGSLPKVEVKTTSAKSFPKLLTNVKVMGAVDQESKSDSGNPARDKTLYEKFFSLLSKHAKFQGVITDVSGNDQSGDFALKLDLNGKSKKVPMKYTLLSDGLFQAAGEFDMNDFKMEKALASVHQACEALHTGKDGASKTWPNVGLTVSANIKKECKP